jgi:hypothetical protein
LGSRDQFRFNLTYPAKTMAVILLTLSAIVWLWPELAGIKIIFLALLVVSGLDFFLGRRIIVFGVTLIALCSAYLIQGLPQIYATINPELAQMGSSGIPIIRVISWLAAVLFIIYANRTRSIVEKNLSQFEIPFLSSTSKQGEITHPDVYLCKTLSNRPVIIKGMDRYLHTLLIGVTGSGKTSAVLEPMIWQDLQNYRRGHQLGITVVAPDSEFPHKVKYWCQQLSIPYHVVDLDDPRSNRFNPLEGDPTTVSEIMRTVLRATFGEQEAFFAQAQELHAKNTMLLLKRLRGDNINLLDVYQALMDVEGMQSLVDDYEEQFGEDVITEYFKKEAFGRNKDKLHQFAMGLRLQISDLLTNQTIQNVLVGRSDISLDHVMPDGGVLLFNTSLGKMGHMSKIFGQFLIMHIQNAVFRRPGTEFTRIPHYLYIDELPVYYNPELESLLNIGRKYRCACTFTIQGPSQLEVGRQGQATREKIMNGCRNKIVLGIESSRDAQLISETFGEREDTELRKHRKRFAILPDSYAETVKLKSRFDYTKILELDRWHGIVKIVSDGRNMEPAEGIFEPPWDFQARIARELEKNKRLTLAQ